MNVDPQLLRATVACTCAAGAAIRAFFRDRDAYTVTEKSVNNPLTDADLAADRLLRRELLALLPEAGWLSEETADSPERLSRRLTWVVDPLDGTLEFVKGIPEFAVSVALVVDKVPTLAVVYDPMADVVYAALRGHGATRNGRPVSVSKRARLRGATVDASRSERQRGEFNPVEDLVKVRTWGSIALKLARVAAGVTDVTWSRGPKNEWDICAGTLLVEEAGGSCADLQGRALRFNQPHPRVTGIVADNGHLHAEVLALIKRLGAARVGDQRA